MPENNSTNPTASDPPPPLPHSESGCETPGDAVRFLIEQNQTAQDHQVARSNILVTINTAAIAGALVWLPSAPPRYAWLGIVVAFAGILFCILWIQLNLISQFLLARYEADARRIASENPNIRKAFFISLMFREHIENPKTPSAQKRLARCIDSTLGRHEMDTKPREEYLAAWTPNPRPEWFGYDFLDLRRPSVPSQTELMNLVVMLFAAIWLAVGIAAAVRCFDMPNPI